MAAVDSIRSAAVPPRSARRRVEWVWVLAGAALAALATILVARRLSGSLVRPLEPVAFILASAAAVVGGWKLRSRMAAMWERWPHGVRIAAYVVCGAAVLAVVAAVTIPGTPWAAAAVAWLLVVAGETACAWRAWIDRTDRRSEAAAPSTVCPVDHGDWQKLNYRRSSAGESVVEGWQVIDLAPGQRTAHAHVAICPALPAAPLVSAWQIEGPELRVQVGQALACGVRLDLKRPPPADAAARVRVAFRASCQPEPGRSPAKA
jgi:hypothetical protein